MSIFQEPYVRQFIVFLVAYCIAGKLGQATTNIRSSNLGPVWPAYGIALAAFLVCGYRIWPAIASGAFLIAFFSPVTHLTALGQAAGATFAAFSGAFLLRRVANFDRSLSRLRDGLALILIGATGSAMISASIGTSVLYATQVHAYSGLGSAWLIYWLGDATGVLLVTPVVLTLSTFLRREQARITELVALLVLLTAACFLIFGDPAIIPVRLHVLAFAVLPFVIWGSVRFGVMGAGLSVLLIATIATVETALGSGPFAASSPFTNAVLLDAFFAVLSGTGITLASTIAEREQAQHDREQSVRERAVLEARVQAEQLVRASEERLRLAQQVARIGTFERDVRTGRIVWAEGLEPLYGLPPGSLHGKSLPFFKDLVHPADWERATHLIQQALKSGQLTEGEWRAIWPDGGVHWIVSRWKVLMDDAGEPSRVVGVNMDVTERKRAEEALVDLNRMLEARTASLQSSEELLKIFVKHVPVAVAMLDRDLRYLQVSDRWCSDNSVEASGLLGRLREELPEMPERWKEVNRRALQGESLRADEDRWESKGCTRWARWEVLPWRKFDGTVGGVLVFAEDITERKQMEEELSDMSRKLIESQEQERVRIGRELHDDINQRLAMVAVQLGQLKEHPSEVGIRVQDLRKQLTEISNDVQALSHDLHSSKLDYLGVVAGMKSWCKEFSERQNIEIIFRSDVPGALPLDIGRALFRVLQESVHNASKHSGVKRVDVQLHEESREIHLIVSDAGRGFDADAALHGKGLGLTSMRERVRLLNGTIAIDSKPTGGTTIHVRVPIEQEHGTHRKTG